MAFKCSSEKKIHTPLTLFFYLKECMCERRGGAGGGERAGGRENLKGRMSVEHNAGLDPMTLGSWPEPKSRVGCSTEPPTHPNNICYLTSKIQDIIFLLYNQYNNPNDIYYFFMLSLQNLVRILHLYYSTFQLGLVTLQELNSHVWLVVTISDNTGSRPAKSPLAVGLCTWHSQFQHHFYWKIPEAGQGSGLHCSTTLSSDGLFLCLPAPKKLCALFIVLTPVPNAVLGTE